MKPDIVEPLDAAAIEVMRSFMEEHIPFNKLLGMKLVLIKRGFAHLRLPFRDELVGDPFKPALHGGVLSTLADTVGGAAVFTVMEPGSKCSTIDLRVDYLSPGKLEDIQAQASVLRLGNRVAVTSIKVFQKDEDAPIAVAMGVYAVKRAT